MSRKKANPEACDYCCAPIFGPCVIVSGVDDGKGLALPAEFQERAFCEAACFWNWCAANKPATSNTDEVHRTEQRSRRDSG
jgi:hypothetical protein